MIAPVMPTLAAWLHDLDPYLVRFSANLGIGWYGLSYIAGFAIGWLLLRWLAKRGAVLLPSDRALDAVMIAAAGVFVGGRLGYVAFYQPSLLWTFTADPPFWGLLATNRGGMASHGGMLGVLVAGIWIARMIRRARPQLPRVPLLHVADMLVLIAPPGLFLGRLANFINGELLGKVVARPGEAAPWWSVRYPQELWTEYDLGLRTEAQESELVRLADQYRLPDQPLEAGLETALTQLRSGAPGLSEQLAPLVSARHPSQLYQAVTEGLLVLAVLWLIARKPTRPGVITGAFLIAYGIVRIATEFVRLPDAHFAVPQPLGLSRGQWLSAAMVVAGTVTIVLVMRAKRDKLGGWARNAPRA
ncbi:MAG: prolipoprotein diacylglyceryl transferase [Planctomycetota bacterium]